MIHPPYKRIHKVPSALTAVAVVVAIGTVTALLTSAGFEQYQTDYLLGGTVVVLLGLAAVLVLWIVYLGSQRSFSLSGRTAVFTSWMHRWHLGDRHAIHLDTIDRVLLIRPHHIEIVTRDRVVRIGAFWWRQDEYEELQRLLAEHGVKVEYRELPGFGNVVSSW